MKSLVLTLILATLIMACKQTSKIDNTSINETTDTLTISSQNKSKSLSDLFTLEDAVRILGEPAYLADSSTSILKEVSRFQGAYKANTEDPESRKLGAIYLLFEEYSSSESAHEKFITIKSANQDHGIKTLDNLGDEAYFHTDNVNFYFIMIRKGMKVVTMKVNKITNNTFLDEFNSVAERISMEM